MKSIRNSNGRVVAVTSALVLAVVIGAGFFLRPAVRTQSSAEAAVRDVLMKSALSFEKNDRAMAAEVWADDESLTVFEQWHANYGWADYRDHHLFSEMGEMKNTKYALNDIRAHLAGTTAWATFKYTISGDVTEEGKTRHVDGGGLGTAVLEERQGRWQIMHWHSSAPRRAPAAAPSPAKQD